MSCSDLENQFTNLAIHSDSSIPTKAMKASTNSTVMLTEEHRQYEGNPEMTNLVNLFFDINNPIHSDTNTIFFSERHSTSFIRFTTSLGQEQPICLPITNLLERWLKNKLWRNTGEIIPILQESPQETVEGIVRDLREGFRALRGLSRALINIRAGHVYLLHVIDDQIEIGRDDQDFFQQYPLWLEISIKVQPADPTLADDSCQVLATFENVTMPLPQNQQQMHCLFEVISTDDGLKFNGGCVVDDTMAS